MKIIYSPLHKKHNPNHEIYEGEKARYPEVGDRIEIIAKALRGEKDMQFVSPKHFDNTILNTIHHPNYVKALQERSNLLRPSEQVFPSYFIRDTYAPITHGTYEAARDAVNCALTGAQLLLNEERLVYGLCRPPGHHAEYFAIGGYCYFNNAAAAAEYLSHHGAVAILDIDFHHGNGTQNIFYTRDDVFYVSLHADPNKKYPYVAGFAEETGIEKGRGYNRNYPLPLTTSETMYRKTLVKAIQTIRDFDPSFLIVSGGFDTYIKDPIGGLNLTVPFYEIIGKDINSLHLPTLIIQEGGYFVKDLGEIACSFLKGFK